MHNARLILFAAIAGVILLALPIANIASRAAIGAPLIPGEPRDLWSLDRIEGNLSYLAVTRFERSPFPGRVRVGRGGYLFLGDDDGAVMAKTTGAWRVPDGLIADQAQRLARLDARIAAADAQFLAVIAPNKHSVYPDKLPADVTPAGRTVTDDLAAEASARDVPLLDLRPAMRRAREGAQAYLRTDTHWTYASAAAAYEAIMERLGKAPVGYDLTPVPAGAGDLARLLKMDALHPPDADQNQRIALAEPFAGCAAEITLSRGTEGPCTPARTAEISVMDRKMRVTRNPGAPGPETLLMLCDSFCTASSALFNASFSEVYRVHWKFIDDAALDDFLARVSPDIVILQMVERDALSLGLGG